MSDIRFVDTTLRDGHQSLWHESMTTGMMLAVAERMDNAGFEAIELLSSSHIKKCVRELKEDPWERVRMVAKKIKKTPLRLIAGRFNAFEVTPQSIYCLFVERMAANGMRESRISDEWNNLGSWKRKVAASRDAGLKPIVNLIYSVSPRHSDEYYAQKAREASTLPVVRLCLKDPGGLLTPERTAALVPLIQQNSNGIPLELHTHCTTGLGPLCCLEAIRLGVEIVNTAVPPLANGSSNPSLFNVAHNAQALGYTPAIDQGVLKPVEAFFTSVALRENFPIGAPVEYDETQYQHQVPGGMISNLAHQLRKVGMENRLEEALDEAIRVRSEFGYPIMVTPLSQFVGSQAAINVIVGERYREVTDQTIHYALGRWGEEGGLYMNADVKDKILNRPRGRELAKWEPPEPSIPEVRQKIGAPGISDDELLLRWLLSTDEIAAMRAMGPAKEYLSARHPLITLLEELTRRKGSSVISFKTDSVSVVLEKKSGVPDSQ